MANQEEVQETTVPLRPWEVIMPRQQAWGLVLADETCMNIPALPRLDLLVFPQFRNYDIYEVMNHTLPLWIGYEKIVLAMGRAELNCPSKMEFEEALKITQFMIRLIQKQNEKTQIYLVEALPMPKVYEVSERHVRQWNLELKELEQPGVEVIYMHDKFMLPNHRPNLVYFQDNGMLNSQGAAKYREGLLNRITHLPKPMYKGIGFPIHMRLKWFRTVEFPQIGDEPCLPILNDKLWNWIEGITPIRNWVHVIPLTSAGYTVIGNHDDPTSRVHGFLFQFSGFQFQSIEQAYQVGRAIFSKQYGIAILMLHLTSAAPICSLSHLWDTFEAWQGVKEQFMMKIALAKYHQCFALRERLHKTGKTELFYHHSHPFWSTRVDHEMEWVGHNKMGEIWQTIRDKNSFP